MRYIPFQDALTDRDRTYETSDRVLSTSQDD